jgi:hypothetical protein
MKHIRKINEFINESEIYSLIEKAEDTSSSDPVYIANRDPYKKIIKIGKQIIPYLVERNSYIWNIALKEITGIVPKGEKSSEIVDFWNKWALENGYKK